MIDYEMVHFPPSIVASAALAFALLVLDSGKWVSLSCFSVSCSQECWVPPKALTLCNISSGCYADALHGVHR